MKSFCFAAKNENSPFYLHIPSVFFQVTRLPYSLIRHRGKKKKKNHQISYFPYVQTDIVEASLKAFISLLTANWTSFNVTTTSQEPKRLKKRRKFENQKKKLWVFLYPRTVFFREAQAETADKRSWFDWAVPSLAFFSSLASLALSLSRSLAPSMATFPSSLGGAPACASLSESLFSKKMLFANQLIDFQTGNCGSVTKSWHQQPLLLPNQLYRFHGSLPFTMDVTFVLPESWSTGSHSLFSQG